MKPSRKDRDEHTLGPTKVGAGGGVTDPVRIVRRHDSKEDAQILAFAVEAARLMSDLHCENVLLLDVRGLSQITDYVMIATGTSERQIRSVAEDLQELAAKTGVSHLGRETDGRANWVVVDFVDVVVHLFDAPTRAFYDLEMMWGDADRIPWRRE